MHRLFILTAHAAELKNPLGTTDFQVLVDRVTDFLIKLAIPVAVLLVVIAGFQMIIYSGNNEKVGAARKMIYWALAGLVIVILAKGLTSLILDIIQ